MKTLITLTILITMCTSNIFSQSTSRDWSLSTSPGLTGEFKLTNAEIEISNGNSSSVEIKLETNNPDLISEFEIMESSGGFSIKQKESVRTTLNQTSNVKFIITIPDYYNLNLSSASGDMKIYRIEGEKNIKSASSEILIKDSQGDILINTANGNIELENCIGMKDINSASGDVLIRYSNGDTKINTASGDITLSHADGNVYAGTASGDIRITTSSNVKSVSANSYSGDITINLSSTPDVSLKANTLSGDIIVDESFNVINSNDRLSKSATTILGNGTISVECSNVSGDINFSK